MPNPTTAVRLLIAAIVMSSASTSFASAEEVGVLSTVPPDAAPPLDNLWWDGFDRIAGFDGAIVRLLHVGSDLVVTGEFTRVGTTSVRRIARWDGIQWNPMAGGLDAVPRSMVVYDGQLIVGDNHRVRAWSGSEWTDLGAGAAADDLVRRLHVHDGRLFVSLHKMGLRSYDGNAWTTITVPGPSAVILALATYEGDLHAGGNFAQLGGVSAPNIARWDGTAWHRVGNGTNGRVEQLSVEDGALFVGGSFTSIDGRPIANLARWQGGDWSSTPGGYFVDLFQDQGQWIGVKAKNTGSAHFLSQTGWGPYAPNGIQQFLRIHTGIVHEGSNYLSVTALDALEGPYFHLFRAAGAGSTWFPISPVIGGAGLDGPVTLMASRSDGVVVGGSFRHAGDTPVEGFERWDGGMWHPFAPYPPGPAHAVLDFEGELVSGGQFMAGLNSIAHWNGTQWQPFGDGFSKLGYSSAGSVRTLAVYQGQLIAGGLFGRSGSMSLRNIARWDGVGWQPLGVGLEANQNGVLAMTVWDGKLIATTRISATGGLVSAWDGAQWTQLGETWEAQSLANFNGQLYASHLRYRGGTFLLARWNGVDWIEVPSIYDVGKKLFVYGTRLVQGDWTWDGSHWARLGPGIAGSIATMAEFDGSLYCGGDFQLAGDKRSFYIARYDGAVTPKSHPALNLPTVRIATQPAFHARELTSGAIEIEWSGAGPQARFEIFDVRGRRVGVVPIDAHTDRGTLFWDRRGADGALVARGVYVMRMHAGDTAASRKLILLRTPGD